MNKRLNTIQQPINFEYVNKSDMVCFRLIVLINTSIFIHDYIIDWFVYWQNLGGLESFQKINLY